MPDVVTVNRERRKRDNEDGHHVFGAAAGLPFKRQSLPSSGTDVNEHCGYAQPHGFFGGGVPLFWLFYSPGDR